jgi:DNA-binding transcriptional ArsR family regulator
MSEQDRWSAPPLQVRDPAMLRAFAHPIRQRILRELAVRNHARAADLAVWLGEPANTLSFHLRTLAKAGLVREVAEKARDRRDRVWELVSQGGYSFDEPISNPAVSAYMSARVDWLHRLLAGELDTELTVSAVQFGGALLTKAEAEQFAAELGEVLTKWRRLGAENAERDPDNPERVEYDTSFAIGPAARDR